jgi:hypothetical protein
MKLTIIFLLLAFAAAAQNPLAEVTLKTHTINGITTIDSVARVWKVRKDVTATPGTSYTWTIPGDTAYYFKAPDGVIVEATLTFKVKGTQPPPPVETSVEVNDNSTAITYSANWFYASGSAGWLQKFPSKDVHYTVTAGSVATHNFTGTKVAVAAELCDNHGVARIQVLKGTTVLQTQDVDMYKNTGGTGTNACPNGERAVIFTSNEFPKDNYTVRVSLLSVDLTKVPRRDSMVFDALTIFSK